MRLHAAIAILLLGSLAACGGEGTAVQETETAQPAPDTTAAAGALLAEHRCGLSGFRAELLARVNEARSSSRICGSQSFPAAPALTWNDLLFRAAAGHAADMAAHDYFSHDSRDGRTFSQRISDTGYSWWAVGENIAAGQADVAQVVQAWLDSPGHCANIMSPSFTEVGVACARDDASTHIQYWAMSLGQPR